VVSTCGCNPSSYDASAGNGSVMPQCIETTGAGAGALLKSPLLVLLQLPLHLLLLLLLHLPTTLMGNSNTTCAYKAVPPEFQSLVSVEGGEGGEGEWGRCKFCHALAYNGHIVSQGCWLEGDGCSSPCLLSPLGRDQLSFCCCHGDLCNLNPKPAQALNSEKNKRRHHSEGEVSRRPLPSLSLPPTPLSPTELGLLAALVVLLALLLLLLFLLFRQQQQSAAASNSHQPQPAPLLKCLHTRRKATGPWAEDRPLLVGLGVSALLDLERG